jgi:hypothetical protein
MTAATTNGLERPPLTCTVKLEDESEYTIKMSYGLHQDLQRMVPDPGAIVDTIAADPYARDYILRRCMTPEKKLIKDESELKAAEDLGLDDPDEMNKLLQWATGHLLYFFGISAGGLKQLAELLASKLDQAQPAPSTSGSQS